MARSKINPSSIATDQTFVFNDIQSDAHVSLTKLGDLSGSQDLNNNAYRNSVFYSLNPTNAPHSNNGVGFYLSTYGLGGSSDDSAQERALQFYAGDTVSSGFYYRVKQGPVGWHPWVPVSSGIRGVYSVSTATHTTTTSQSGFTFLERTFTRVNPTSANEFLIIATVNGSANDDANAVLEYYDGSSWSQPAALRGDGNTGGASNSNASFGDFSVVRSAVMEDKQTVQYTACFVHAATTTATTIGYRVRVGAENASGCYVNRSMGWDNGFNSNTSRSSMIIFELGGNVNT